MNNLNRFCITGLLASLMLILSACGGGTTGDITPKAQFSTTNYDMYLPEGIETKALPEEMDGMYVFDGNNGTQENPSEKIRSRENHEEILQTSERDVAGIVIQTKAFSTESSAEEMLASFHSTIQPLLFSSAFSKRQVDLLKEDAINAQLEVELIDKQHSTEFLNSMILALFPDITNDQLSTTLGKEPFVFNYTINIGIVFNAQDDIVLTLTLVPSELVKTYTSVVNQITDTGNILSKGTELVGITDKFSGQAGGGKADFLFVVDNSGSMGNEQQALSDAADAFISAMESSGLDYEAGVITTDSASLRGLGFTSDASQFKIDVIPGTSGDSQESGIYFSELALQSISEGDINDGSVTSAGYPRADASLSIIYLSDEPNSYRNGVFDPLDNLFLSRGYTVYAIINESSRISGLYDDLADNTNGFTADIDTTALFPEIMNNIAQAAGGASSWYALSKQPLSSTIEVKINGVIIESSAINGWTYSVASNSILFHGDAVPAEGTNIEVSYFVAQKQTNPSPQVTGNEALKGSWTGICEVNEEGGHSNSTVTFSGNTFNTVKNKYSDSVCSVIVETSFSLSGTFIIGNEITTTSGVSANEIEITILKDKSVDVNDMFYDIFKIDNGKLFFGISDEINDGNSPSKRPLDLDLDSYFTKK